MKINTVKTTLIAGALALAMASCGTSSQIAYVNDAPRDTALAVTGEFSKGIQPNDLLNIYVESESPEVTLQFNQETNKIAYANGSVINPGSTAVTGYLVNQDGEIIFPVLGKIKVAGMTHDSLAHMLEKRLVNEGHILDATVTIKLMNFKVSILGDVVKPGVIQATGERLTIFEALSMVGDLTIYGQRTNVTVIREENGVRTIGELDLTSKDIFNSPYYYLHQNDVVYVEPNKKRKRDAERDNIMLTYVTSAVSIVSTIASLFYYYALINYYDRRTN
ncbi:MAG: polysaccharide biosynthesis/export family protein [Bacteroidales bacterium]|nr:polysaccharide biosynthesis/export family protein [Bacteroidales bacterium]